MSREIKRGIPFPRPSGRELPLPSDMNNGTRETVENLLSLWRHIYKEKIFHDREETATLINSFYEGLDVEVCRWLETEDPRYRRSRGILVKERAMQLTQIENTPFSKRQHRGKKRRYS